MQEKAPIKKQPKKSLEVQRIYRELCPWWNQLGIWCMTVMLCSSADYPYIWYETKEDCVIWEYTEVKKSLVVKKEVKQAVKTDFDINKLAYCVSIAETWWFTKWYWVTHNNWQGIKHGNTILCPWVRKMAMCKFKTKEESNQAFITIRNKWYKGMPNIQKAIKWTWADSANDWLRIVKWCMSN